MPVDVRIVAASLVPLSELVATKRLREDLAARLAGVSVEIPPLAQRRPGSRFLTSSTGARG
jgi:DNA-binding NtrC family response regulator